MNKRYQYTFFNAGDGTEQKLFAVCENYKMFLESIRHATLISKQQKQYNIYYEDSDDTKHNKRIANNTKWLKSGNSKLSKNILLWSIPPVKTCINSNDCKHDCYCLKAYRIYPNVRTCWDDNLKLSHDTNLFEKTIINELKTTKKSVVRIHQSGDFYSNKYIDSWFNIIKKFPDIKFYGYSKVFGLLNIEKLNSLSNCNIINSVLPNGKINYGSLSYCQEMKEKYKGGIICIATLKKGVVCGKHCKKCQTTKKPVVFVKH